MKTTKRVTTVLLVVIFINAASFAFVPALHGRLNAIIALILTVPFFGAVIYGVLKTHARSTDRFDAELRLALEWFIYIFGIIVNYAVIYGYFGLIESSSCRTVDALAKCRIEHRLFTGIYFSVDSFTTVGYGGFIPHEDFGRALSASEAFFGYFLFGIIVARFVNLFSDQSS